MKNYISILLLFLSIGVKAQRTETTPASWGVLRSTNVPTAASDVLRLGDSTSLFRTAANSLSLVQIQTRFNAKQNTISLTTVGSNGAATFNPGTSVLNIPNYNLNATTIVEITGTSQSGNVNTIYIPHNATLTSISLPSLAAVGAIFQIVGEGVGGWKITQASGQIIVGVGVTTTTGTTGYIQSSNANCTISLRYTNTDKWTVTSSQGTLTYN